jgi:small redox-active disulfide protein 2
MQPSSFLLNFISVFIKQIFLLDETLLYQYIYTQKYYAFAKIIKRIFLHLYQIESMAENEIKQIMINGRLVGIAGLDDIIQKIVKTHQGKSDEDIINSLLSEISANNYVPPGAVESYGKALLREFKIAQGLPVAEEPSPELDIAVLGMGCARCNQLEDDVRGLLSEMKIAASLRHITDFKEIARFGVISTPALAINNKVVSVGEVPPKSKIRQWIIDAYPQPLK